MKAIYRHSGKAIELTLGKIIEYPADALVCPWDSTSIPDRVSSLDSDNPIRSQFLSALTPEQVSQLRGFIGGRPVGALCGESFSTKGDGGHVIHAFVPYTDGGIEWFVKPATRGALTLASTEGLTSLGFPLLNEGRQSRTGKQRIEEVVDAMSEEFAAHFERKSPIQRVGIVLYDVLHYNRAENVLDKKFSRSAK